MEHVIILSLLIFAIHYTMQEGEIFGFIGNWLSKLPGWTHDPLYDCPVCMTFWYGYPLYWAIWHVSWVDWLITVIAAMGLNAVILKMAPDKDTPGYHQQLSEIAESLNDTNQLLKSTMDDINIFDDDGFISSRAGN